MTVSQVEKYPEILKLFEYCKNKDIECELIRLWDGYQIRFKNGADVVQHDYSYGGEVGYVEFCIGIKKVDYRAIPLKRAKMIVRKHKEKLNSEREEN